MPRLSSTQASRNGRPRANPIEATRARIIPIVRANIPKPEIAI